MFDLGFQEIVIVLVVALIFIGPKHLPEIARTLGRAMREMRRASDELRAQINLEAMMAERGEEEADNPTGGDPLSTRFAEEDHEPSSGARIEAAPVAHDQDQGEVSQKTQA